MWFSKWSSCGDARGDSYRPPANSLHRCRADGVLHTKLLSNGWTGGVHMLDGRRSVGERVYIIFRSWDRDHHIMIRCTLAEYVQSLARAKNMNWIQTSVAGPLLSACGFECRASNTAVGHRKFPDPRRYKTDPQNFKVERSESLRDGLEGQVLLYIVLSSWSLVPGTYVIIMRHYPTLASTII